MQTVTLHRRTNGDPATVRIVEDGFRTSVFVLPPAALLARGLWGACLVWLVLVVAIIAAVVAGALSSGAALAAILVLNFILAIDAANLERRRLEKRGWPVVALAGPLGVAGPVSETPQPVAASPASATPASPASTDVIGLFPGERR